MSFKNYLKRLDSPGVAFTFGRCNPPHKGNQENFNELSSYARKNKMDAFIFTSFTQNSKKNPLSPGDKLYFLNKMAPKNVIVSNDDTLKSAFKILEDLIKNRGYKRIAFLVGEDQETDFQSMKKYAKNWSNGEAYLDIVVSGSRTPEISGSELRNYAKQDDFENFKKGLSNKLSAMEKKELFNKVKAGLEK